MAAFDLVKINTSRKLAGDPPADDVKYRWVDDGYSHPRLPTADYIRAEAVDYTGSGKKRYWNP